MSIGADDASYESMVVGRFGEEAGRRFAVRMRYLRDDIAYLRQEREPLQADQKRGISTDLRALDRAIELITDEGDPEDARLLRRLQFLKKLVALPVDRAKRKLDRARIDDLILSICDSIAEARQEPVSFVSPGRNPEDGRASGDLPMVIHALNFIGFFEPPGTTYARIRRVLKFYKEELSVDEAWEISGYENNRRYETQPPPPED